MKKLLVSVVFLLMLMWVKGAKNVQAAVGLHLKNDGRFWNGVIVPGHYTFWKGFQKSEHLL